MRDGGSRQLVPVEAVAPAANRYDVAGERVGYRVSAAKTTYRYAELPAGWQAESTRPR